MERNLFNEVKEAFETKNAKMLDEALIEMTILSATTEEIIDDKVSEVEYQRRSIAESLYFNLQNHRDLFEKLTINFEEINYWIMDFINYLKKSNFLYNLHEEFFQIDKKGYKIDGLFVVFNNMISKIVYSTFRNTIEYYIDSDIITQEDCDNVEKEIDYILDTLVEKFNELTELKKQNSITDEHNDFVKKFLGNPITKRRNGNLEKYRKVAYLIKIFNTDFKYVNGAQKRACEIAGCSEYSFSKWKNSSKKISKGISNNDIYFKWQNELPGDVVEKFKEEINKYLQEYSNSKG